MNITLRDQNAAIRAQLSIKDKLPAVDPTTIKTITAPFKTVELPAAQKAEVAETEKRTAALEGPARAEMARARDNAIARGNSAPPSLGDFTSYSADQARGQLAAIEKIISNPSMRKWTMSAKMGDQTTTSLETMAQWLRQKIGGGLGDPSQTKAGAIVDLSA